MNCAAASVLPPQLRQYRAAAVCCLKLRRKAVSALIPYPQARKNTRQRAISPLEVRPMGQKSRHKSEDAIRREWLRKLKELWEKRKRRKRQPK